MYIGELDKQNSVLFVHIDQSFIMFKV